MSRRRSPNVDARALAASCATDGTAKNRRLGGQRFGAAAQKIWAVSAILVAAAGIVGYSFRDRLIPAPEPVSIEHPERVDAQVVASAQRLQERVRQSPRSVELHGELGALYEANGLTHEALACFEIASHLDPTDPTWLYHQAVCLQGIQEESRAFDLLKRLSESHPDYSAVAYRCGESHLLQDNLKEAKACFERVVALEPTQPHGYFGLAETHVRLKQFSEARQNAEQALKIAPNYRAANYALGMALRGLGELERAERELAIGKQAKRWFLGDRLEPALDRYRVNTRDAINSALALAQANRRPEAEAILDRALASNPDDLALLNNLAAVCIDMGKFDKGAALLTKATLADPLNFGLCINLSVCYARTDRMADALQWADRAVQLGPQVGRTHMNRADMLIAVQRFDEALVSLQNAARLDARNVDVFMKQGDIYARQKRWEEAREVFETAAELAPQSIKVHLNRGVMATLVGRIDEARRALAAAEQIAPDDPKVVNLRNRLAKLDE